MNFFRNLIVLTLATLMMNVSLSGVYTNILFGLVSKMCNDPYFTFDGSMFTLIVKKLAKFRFWWCIHFKWC